MVQQLIQSFMRQLQGKNMKGYQEVQNMMNMGQNPEPYIKQIVTQLQPEQRQVFFKQLQGMGCPSQILSKLQNMK